jgi:hypothetical protein
MMVIQSYLVDTYLMYAASALAGHTIIRSATGAAFPLFTTQMFLNLGINWAATLLGGIALLLAPMPFLFYKYGPRIRSKSSFAPCIDLKVAKFGYTVYGASSMSWEGTHRSHLFSHCSLILQYHLVVIIGIPMTFWSLTSTYKL